MPDRTLPPCHCGANAWRYIAITDRYQCALPCSAVVDGEDMQREINRLRHA